MAASLLPLRWLAFVLCAVLCVVFAHSRPGSNGRRLSEVLAGLRGSYRAYIEFAEAKFVSGDFAAALPLFRKLAERCDRFGEAPGAVAHVHTRLAECAALSGDADAAASIFRACTAALKKAPVQPPEKAQERERALYQCLANECRAALNDNYAAEDDLKCCDEAFEHAAAAGKVSEALLLRGRKQLQCEQYEEAVQSMEEAVTALENDPDAAGPAQGWLVRALVALGKPQKTCARLVKLARRLEEEQQATALSLAALARTHCERSSEKTEDAVAQARRAVAAETSQDGCSGFVVGKLASSNMNPVLELYQLHNVDIVAPTGVLVDECTAFVVPEPAFDQLRPGASAEEVREACFPAHALVTSKRRRVDVAAADRVLLFVPSRSASYADTVLDVLPKVHAVLAHTAQQVAVLADPTNRPLVDVLAALGLTVAAGTVVPYYGPDVLHCSSVTVAGRWHSSKAHANQLEEASLFIKKRLSRDFQQDETPAPKVVYLRRSRLPGDTSVTEHDEQALVAAAAEQVGAERFLLVHPQELDLPSLLHVLRDCAVIVGAPGPMLAASVWAPSGSALVVLPTAASAAAPANERSFAEEVATLANRRLFHVARVSSTERTACPECHISIASFKSALREALSAASPRHEGAPHEEL